MISPSLIARELAKRGARKDMVLDQRFVKQNAFVEDAARYLAAQCSRRAGKTNGLALRFLRSMEKHPKSQCFYLALTLDSAMEIMWPVMKEMNDTYRLSLRFVDSKYTIYHPNGSKLRIYGADMKNFVKRLKGRKSPAIGLDEAQDFGTHLETLVNDVLTPMLADYEDGWIAITGTPGPVPQGYFFDLTHGKKFGFSMHDWTLLDNPFMPNPDQFMADLKARRGWDDRHPTLLREWQNQWVLDVESLWIRYAAAQCDYKELPPANYNYIMGIDLGFNDADAIAIIAWSEHDKITYLVEEHIARKQGLTELVQNIEKYRKKYDIAKLIIDQGGLGLKLAEEMRRQHHIPVVGAEKQRKQETVEFLNDAMRQGRFKARANSQFALDSYLIQIDWERTTPDRIVVKKQPHSDIIDAVIYAFKESPAYAYEAPVPKPKPKTPEWYDNEVNEMEQAAEAYFTAKAEALND